MNGVKGKKTTMGRQQWKVTFHGPHKKRGRPKLSDENLNSDAYKERRRLKEVRDKFIKEMGKDMALGSTTFGAKTKLARLDVPKQNTLYSSLPYQPKS